MVIQLSFNMSKYAILMVFFFLLIVKENDNNNIQMKFQVHSTNMFGLGAKTNIAKWQPPPLPLNFYSSPYSLPQGRVVNFFYHPPPFMHATV